jgi:hypothetical protein
MTLTFPVGKYTVQVRIWETSKLPGKESGAKPGEQPKETACSCKTCSQKRRTATPTGDGS